MMPQKLLSFLKLVRWPNLIIIILAQLMLHFLLIGHVLRLIHVPIPLNGLQVALLIISTVFMAAFGYVFNDITDEQVDRINKENKQIVGNQLSPSTAQKIAILLLIFALVPAFALAMMVHMWQLILIHLFIAVGLWYYSIYLKRTLLIGNLIISLFTALSIAIVWIYHLAAMRYDAMLLVNAQKSVSFISYSVLFYSAFAFIISWIREMIKDVEDQKGDEQFGMQTFVIRFGLAKTKTMTQMLITIMAIMLGFAIYLCYHFHWGQMGIYLAVAVGVPLIYLFSELRKAVTVKDFADLSNLAKIIMVAGILSIQLFNLNYGS